MVVSFSSTTARVRKFSWTKVPRLAPIWSFLRGMIAVCGIGSPMGCRNRAVTANQSASAPTIDASAVALTYPTHAPAPEPISTQARKTAAATRNSPVASRFMRVRSRARCGSSRESARGASGREAGTSTSLGTGAAGCRELFGAGRGTTPAPRDRWRGRRLGQRRSRSAGRRAQGDVDLLAGVPAADGQRDRRLGGGAAHRGGQLGRGGHGAVAERDDDVAGLQTGLGCGAVSLHLDDLGARADLRVLTVARRPGADAQHRVGRRAGRDDLLGDSLSSVTRDGEADADVAALSGLLPRAVGGDGGDRGIDADHLAGPV